MKNKNTKLTDEKKAEIQKSLNASFTIAARKWAEEHGETNHGHKVELGSLSRVGTMTVPREDKAVAARSRVEAALRMGRMAAKAFSRNRYTVTFKMPSGGLASRLFEQTGDLREGEEQDFAVFRIYGKPTTFINRVIRTFEELRVKKIDWSIRHEELFLTPQI